MAWKFAFGLLIAAALACGGSAPSSDVPSCLAQMPPDKLALHNTVIESYMKFDDFGHIAGVSQNYAQCDHDIAFTYYWNLYVQISQQSSHPVINRAHAQAAFDGNWKPQ